MKSISTRNIVLCGLLIALAVVLGTLPAIRIALMGSYNLKVSFMVVPCILAGLLMGPLYGFAVGFLADFITTLLVPTGGSYLPIFSIIMGGMGMCPALFSMPIAKLTKLGRQTFRVLLPSILLSQFLFSTLANTAVLAWLMLETSTESFGGIFAGLVAGRSVSLILVPMHAFLCVLLARLYRKVSPAAQ
jgi:ECF transporter S component (folate family)